MMLSGACVMILSSIFSLDRIFQVLFCVTFFLRSLGVHISKVRSVTLDDWEPEMQKVTCVGVCVLCGDGRGIRERNRRGDGKWEEVGEEVGGEGLGGDGREGMGGGGKGIGERIGEGMGRGGGRGIRGR